MVWVITTTSAQKQFYVFNDDGSVVGLADRWDNTEISQFNDKQAAKDAAKKAGLKTWAYLDLHAKTRAPK